MFWNSGWVGYLSLPLHLFKQKRNAVVYCSLNSLGLISEIFVAERFYIIDQIFGLHPQVDNLSVVIYGL